MRKIPVLTLLIVLFASLASAGRFIPAGGLDVPAQYIVVFDDAFPATQVAAGVAAEHGAQAERVFRHALNGALLTGITDGQARALAADPRVRWVEPDQVVSIDTTETNPPSWGLDRIDQRALPLDASYTYDFDGTGVDLYVIDTGIRETHIDFGGRASRDFDSVGDGQNGVDCNGHGTHVAGTAGGATYGVAKNVRIHAVRVLNCAGSGTVSGVIAGIDFVTGRAQNDPGGLFVANMSLGGGASASLDSALDNSVAAGVFYAVAAGNSAADACNSSPAGAAGAFTVGSTDIDDTRSSFSNFGTCVDIFAPGRSITSAWNTGDSATNTISGTSMASPHVAGAAALVRQELPAASVDQVKAELVARGTCGVVANAGAGSPDLLLFSRAATDPGCGGGGGGCTLGQKGDACTSDAGCCTNTCRGPRGRKTCK